MSFNTGNPIGSISEEDCYDNMANLDQAMNSTNPTWRDRFGVEKPTINAALKSAGFMPAGFDFVTGGTLQPGDRNKAVYNPMPNGDNNWYRWNGTFPKEIAANSQPEPKNENSWVPVNIKTGVVEREVLRRTYQEAGLTLIPGSFEAGGTLTGASDVLLQETSGKAYGWNGAFPKVVEAGGAITGFVDKSFVMSEVTPDMFGAKGDGITDDSQAFRAAATYLQPTQNNNVTGTLVIPNKRYCIGSEVDLGKINVRGESMSTNRVSCIQPVVGYEGILLKWDGARFENITLSGSSKKGTGLWIDSGYNRAILNCEIGGFQYNVYIDGITVNFAVKDCTFHGGNHAFYVNDKDLRQSTTTYFDNVMFQWVDNGITFRKDAYGCSFSNIIMENIKEKAFFATWWASCKWDTVWWEGRQTADNKGQCINVGIVSGYEDCVATNLYPRDPWVNGISSETTQAEYNALSNFGGSVIDKNAFRARNKFGTSTNYGISSIYQDVDAWVQGEKRDLKISTRPASPASGYTSSLILAPGAGGRLSIESADPSSTSAPSVYLQSSGADMTNNGRSFIRISADHRGIYISDKTKYSDISVNNEAIYNIPIHYVFDATKQTPRLNGAEFSISSVGVVRLEIPIIDGVLSSPEFRDPSVVVSGIFGGNLTCAMGVIDSYSGSWSVYRACKGFIFTFRDNTGALVTPSRFTALIAST